MTSKILNYIFNLYNIINSIIIVISICGRKPIIIYPFTLFFFYKEIQNLVVEKKNNIGCHLN